MSEPMMRGTICAYRPDRHYGFITPDDRSPDIFFHVGDVNGMPREGDRVSFDFMFDPLKPGRLRAVNIIRNPGET
jgi:cold shock CspA family protein